MTIDLVPADWPDGVRTVLAASVDHRRATDPSLGDVEFFSGRPGDYSFRFARRD